MHKNLTGTVGLFSTQRGVWSIYTTTTPWTNVWMAGSHGLWCELYINTLLLSWIRSQRRSDWHGRPERGCAGSICWKRLSIQKQALLQSQTNKVQMWSQALFKGSCGQKSFSASTKASGVKYIYTYTDTLKVYDIVWGTVMFDWLALPISNGLQKPSSSLWASRKRYN